MSKLITFIHYIHKFKNGTENFGARIYMAGSISMLIIRIFPSIHSLNEFVRFIYFIRMRNITCKKSTYTSSQCIILLAHRWTCFFSLPSWHWFDWCPSRLKKLNFTHTIIFLFLLTVHCVIAESWKCGI